MKLATLSCRLTLKPWLTGATLQDTTQGSRLIAELTRGCLLPAPAGSYRGFDGSTPHHNGFDVIAASEESCT